MVGGGFLALGWPVLQWRMAGWMWQLVSYASVKREFVTSINDVVTPQAGRRKKASKEAEAKLSTKKKLYSQEKI